MAETLPRRPLGTTGMEVSCLGLGTVKFGRNQSVKYPTQFDLPDDRTVRNILALAQESGINLLDTAPAYGVSEQRLGQLMANRQDWVLCSKVGEEFVNGQSFFDFSAVHTRSSIERSLQRLRTDHLDIVLIHSDGNDEQILQQSDCLETLQQCRDQGLIRAIGMSTKSVSGGMAALRVCDLVMVSCNRTYHEEMPVIEQAAAINKGVLIKKALASGHAVAQGDGDQVAASLDFVLSMAGVSSVVIGSINADHLRHNVAVAIRHHLP